MVRNWTQQFQIRIALHFFWILTGSRSFSRKLDLTWNGSGNCGKKSVQFQFIWYEFLLRISSPKSEQVPLFNVLKAFVSSFFVLTFLSRVTLKIYLTWYNQGVTILLQKVCDICFTYYYTQRFAWPLRKPICYSFMEQIWNFLKKMELEQNWTDFDSR